VHVARVQEEAGERENGEEREEEEVEDEEERGEGALAGEVPREEVEDYGEDACIHAYCEPVFLSVGYSSGLLDWIGTGRFGAELKKRHHVCVILTIVD
jgi:hypothetical protein